MEHNLRPTPSPYRWILLLPKTPRTAQVSLSSPSWITTFLWPLQGIFLIGIHSCYHFSHLRILSVPSPFSSRYLLVTLLVFLTELPKMLSIFRPWHPILLGMFSNKVLPTVLKLSDPVRFTKDYEVLWSFLDPHSIGAVKGIWHSCLPCNSSFMCLSERHTHRASLLFFFLFLLSCCACSSSSPVLSVWHCPVLSPGESPLSHVSPLPCLFHWCH